MVQALCRKLTSPLQPLIPRPPPAPQVGVFTYEEFSQMIGVVRRYESFPSPSEEMAMHAFNSWNDSLDPGINGADYHEQVTKQPTPPYVIITLA